MTPDPETEIRALIAARDAAYHDHDAAGATTPYATDAVIYDLAPPLAGGVDEAETAQWMSGWQGPIAIETRDLRLRIDGDLATGWALTRTRATTLEGQEAQWWARVTLVFARHAGRWRIVHEHVSVPFYMDGSFKAAIDLEP